MPQLLKLGVFEYWTGGVQGLVVTKPDAPFGLPMSQDMWLYYFTLAISIAIYIFSVNLLKSRSGRAFMAIRDNEIAASAMGIDVALYKTLAFGVSAGITGVAGGLGAIAVQFVAPDSYTITLAISLFLGMVVGGVGWLPGSIVGSAFIIFVPNIAEGISKGLSGAVFGVLLFLVIFLVPHGARQVRDRRPATDRQTQEKLEGEELCFLNKNYVSPRSRRRSSLSLPPAAAHSRKRNTTPAPPTPRSRSATSCPIAVRPPPMA